MDISPDVVCESRPLAQSVEADPSVSGERIDGMRAFRGSLRSYLARPELLISAFDFALDAGAASEARSGPCLNVVVLLDGDGESCFAPSGERPAGVSIRYQPGMTYLFFVSRPACGGYRTSRATRFRGVEVRVGLDMLERLGGLELFREPASGRHPLRLAAGHGGWVGAFPTPPALRTAALQMLGQPPAGDQDLVIEARALDILNTALSAMREPLFCRGARAVRNARQLEEAKALMLADLARPWTVRAVARGVGLTEKRLKADFRSRFGLPVYGFLQQSRLEHARVMLEAGGTNVTEAAIAVGYANPSHFAKLFRRQFGMPPSMLSRAGTGTAATPPARRG